MSRPVRNRKILEPPQMTGFKPFGMPVCKLESLNLLYDEYEAFKLVDYENLPQDIAAERMDISRPTLTRIYNSALKKIAKAFVEGHAIKIEGGNVEFDKDWYKCTKCYKLIEGLEKHKKCSNCKSFGIKELTKLNK